MPSITPPKIQHIVLDSGPIIKGLPLYHLAEKFYTIPDVMREIRDASSRQHLAQIPVDLIVKQPSEEALMAGMYLLLL